ncbi:hypothetical protein LTR50_006483 [Elasticomyces elasticus]|nr:hypothetical protein LTR50_006483 [Elasticomyces elasticus]
MSIRSRILLPLAAGVIFASNALALNGTNSICLSYGIDFISGGNYFINTNSNESFTSVSQFEGCNAGKANILLVDPKSDQYECTDVPTTPDDVSQMSTCPLFKNQMYSGDWSILILGNNGDGNPFAYERDFSINAGPQQTTYVTRTVTYTATIIPTTTITSTSVVSTTSTVPATTTVVIPSATQIETITPAPTTVTSTELITRTFNKWTRTQSRVTETVTASCTVPGRPQQPDPTCTIVPTKIALPTGLYIGKRGDRAVDVTIAKRRFADARRRAPAAVQARDLVGRSADVQTVTSTASVAVNTTTTVTAGTSTVTNIVITTSTALITAPPSTIVSGVASSTVTAATPTKVVVRIEYTQIYVTKTMAQTWTLTKTVTPTASATACKRQGGHFGNGWGNRW